MAKIKLVSFGSKNGTPEEYGNYISCLGLKNPHKVYNLKPLDGRDLRVQDYVMASPGFNELMLQARARIPKSKNSPNVVVIPFFCFGGRHRSVAMAELFASELRSEGWEVETYHRDVPNFT